MREGEKMCGRNAFSTDDSKLKIIALFQVH